jgi:hypothetical protein
MKLFLGISMIIIGLLILAGIFVSAFYPKEVEQLKITEPIENITEQSIINTCKNLSLDDTANCLNKKIILIYKYVIRNETEYIGKNKNKDTKQIQGCWNITGNGSFEDVKLNGGDCFDWNNIYCKLAIELNFNGTLTYLATENGHKYATIYTKKEYCTIDQTFEPSCYHLGGK